MKRSVLDVSQMQRVHHKSRSLAARAQTVATVLYLSVLGLLSPLLVVCEDGVSMRRPSW